MESFQKSSLGLCTNCICVIAIMTFFGIYAFGNPDDGNSCYVQDVWSPAINDYQLKITDYTIDGMENIDISWRFHAFFLAYFSLCVVAIGISVINYMMMKEAGPAALLQNKCWLCFTMMFSVIALAVFVIGLFWRFNASGKACSEQILESSGIAIKTFYVVSLFIPCFPCALIILCCC